MLNIILHGYRNAFNFNGRDRRRTFGIFLLIHLTVLIAVGSILIKLLPYFMIKTALFPLIMVWFVPLISFLVRRLHDISLSGWCALPGCLIFFVFVVLMLFAEPSSREDVDNRFGPNPRTTGGAH